MNAPFRIIDRPERKGLNVAAFELLRDGGVFEGLEVDSARLIGRGGAGGDSAGA